MPEQEHVNILRFPQHLQRWAKTQPNILTEVSLYLHSIKSSSCALHLNFELRRPVTFAHRRYAISKSEQLALPNVKWLKNGRLEGRYVYQSESALRFIFDPSTSPIFTVESEENNCTGCAVKFLRFKIMIRLSVLYINAIITG